MTSLRERVIWWIGVNVGLALTPILFNAFSGAGVGWRAAIHHGELIIVAVAMAGLALATAAAADPKPSQLRELRALIVVGGLIFTLAAGLLYAQNYQSVADHKQVSIEAESYLLLGLALILGLTSVTLGHWVAETRTKR